MSVLPLSSESCKCLDRLRQKWWQGYWVQGGVFDFITPKVPGVYTVPSISVITSDIIQIGACAAEDNEGSELLQLSLTIEVEVGTTSSERLWRPPRQRVTEYPPDLNLGSFLNKNIAIDLLRDDAGSKSVIDSLIVREESNQLLIGVDQQVPESILLTQSQQFIKDFVRMRTRVSMPN